MLSWNRRLLLALAFVLVSFLTLSFAMRAVHHARVLRTRPDEPIQPWMNIGYIAHSYHVRPNVIHQALGLPADRPDRRPLRLIAEAQGRSTDALITDIMAAIRRDRESGPPRPEAPPSPPNEPGKSP